MEQTFMPKPQEDTAEFNNAFAFLERLNKFEYMIEDGLMNWKLIETFNVLESYENELCFSFRKDDQEIVDGIKKNIVEILNKYPSIGRKVRGNGKNFIISGQNKTGDFREYLIQLNKKLRDIKNKRGMGMPSKGEGKLF